MLQYYLEARVKNGYLNQVLIVIELSQYLKAMRPIHSYEGKGYAGDQA